MDRKNKNIVLLLGFVPSTYYFFRWVLGMIGDINTAKDVLAIEGIWINWELLSHWLAMGVAFYLVAYNWDLLWAWKRKKKRAAQAKADAAIKQWDMTGEEAINYMIIESKLRHSLKRVAGEAGTAVRIFDEKLRADAFPIAGLRGGVIDQIPKEELCELKLKYIGQARANSVKLMNSQRTVYPAIYVDRRDIEEIWPR